MHELLADYLQRCVQMNGWSQQLTLCGHCAPLCLLTSRLIHKSSSASEAALDRPSGEVADAACQKPTWGGGWTARKGGVKDVRQRRNGQEKMSGRSEKEKLSKQVGLRGKGAAITWKLKKICEPPPIPVPPPCILICTVAYLMQLSLLYPLALTA